MSKYTHEVGKHCDEGPEEKKKKSKGRNRKRMKGFRKSDEIE